MERHRLVPSWGFLAALLLVGTVGCSQSVSFHKATTTQACGREDDHPDEGDEIRVCEAFFDGEEPIECIYMEKVGTKEVSSQSGGQARLESGFEERRVTIPCRSAAFGALRRALMSVVLTPYGETPPRGYRNDYSCAMALRGFHVFPSEPSPYHMILKHRVSNGGYVKIALHESPYPTLMVQTADGHDQVYWSSADVRLWFKFGLGWMQDVAEP